MYSDMKKVYTIILYEKTGADFKNPLLHGAYIHRERVCQDDFCKFSKFKYLSAEKTPNISCRHIS